MRDPSAPFTHKIRHSFLPHTPYSQHPTMIKPQISWLARGEYSMVFSCNLLKFGMCITKGFSAHHGCKERLLQASCKLEPVWDFSLAFLTNKEFLPRELSLRGYEILKRTSDMYLHVLMYCFAATYPGTEQASNRQSLLPGAFGKVLLFQHMYCTNTQCIIIDFNSTENNQLVLKICLVNLVDADEENILEQKFCLLSIYEKKVNEFINNRKKVNFIYCNVWIIPVNRIHIQWLFFPGSTFRGKTSHIMLPPSCLSFLYSGCLTPSILA